MKVITLDNWNEFAIGHTENGTAVISGTRGNWVEVEEGYAFASNEGTEYRCYEERWVETDQDGNPLEEK